jgi:hypothetical protein
MNARIFCKSHGPIGLSSSCKSTLWSAIPQVRTATQAHYAVICSLPLYLGKSTKFGESDDTALILDHACSSFSFGFELSTIRPADD